MNEKVFKRILVFVIFCLGTRLLLAYIAKTQPKYLKLLGYLFGVIGLLMIYLFVTGKRKTGMETQMFGDVIWWNNLRPVHGLLYLLFGYLAIHGDHRAWKIIVVDVLIGLVAFLRHVL